MWKRDNEPAPASPQLSAPSAHSPSASPPSRSESETPAYRPSASSGSAGRAVIGPSLEFTGEIAGGEDLLVEGRLQGKVRLPQNSVTVGVKGRVSADVQARVLEIEGEVEGQLAAEELIALRPTARVRGDLVAPRVVIEDGAKFKGTIDMEPKRSAASATSSTSSAATASSAASASATANAAPRPVEEKPRAQGGSAATPNSGETGATASNRPS